MVNGLEYLNLKPQLKINRPKLREINGQYAKQHTTGIIYDFIYTAHVCMNTKYTETNWKTSSYSLTVSLF